MDLQPVSESGCGAFVRVTALATKVRMNPVPMPFDTSYPDSRPPVRAGRADGYTGTAPDRRQRLRC